MERSARSNRPTDDEPFMCSRQRAYFRGKLLAWRNEILRSTKETRQHLLEESAQYPDLADRASREIERGVDARVTVSASSLPRSTQHWRVWTMAPTVIAKKQVSPSRCAGLRRAQLPRCRSKRRNGMSGANACTATTELRHLVLLCIARPRCRAIF